MDTAGMHLPFTLAIPQNLIRGIKSYRGISGLAGLKAGEYK